MTLTRKDAMATVVTALAVLAFAATHQGWDVWLIGSSHRWAAAAIVALGAVACSLGSAGEEMTRGRQMGATTMVLSGGGAAAAIFAVSAIVSASLTPLSLLVVSIVILWAAATLRHAWHPRHGPVPV